MIWINSFQTLPIYLLLLVSSIIFSFCTNHKIRSLDINFENFYICKILSLCCIVFVLLIISWSTQHQSHFWLTIRHCYCHADFITYLSNSYLLKHLFNSFRNFIPLSLGKVFSISLLYHFGYSIFFCYPTIKGISVGSVWLWLSGFHMLCFCMWDVGCLLKLSVRVLI